MENMRFWDQAEKTPEEHTSEVKQRGGFTAINTQYMLKRMTEIFGPVGIGWGFDVEHSLLEHPKGTLAIADVTVWVESQDKKYGPIRGTDHLITAKGYVDDDAPKKATSDALKKAISHVGVCADIFLGYYDDDKYKRGLDRDKAEKSQSEAEMQRLRGLVNNRLDDIKGLNKPFYDKMSDHIQSMSPTKGNFEMVLQRLEKELAELRAEGEVPF